MHKEGLESYNKIFILPPCTCIRKSKLQFVDYIITCTSPYSDNNLMTIKLPLSLLNVLTNKLVILTILFFAVCNRPIFNQ